MMKQGLFWFCLLGIIIAALIPRFVVKAFMEYFKPSDIQVAREMEKYGSLNEVAANTVREIPMTSFANANQRIP